jgi:hypothetical protein
MAARLWVGPLWLMNGSSTSMSGNMEKNHKGSNLKRIPVIFLVDEAAK